MTTLVFLDSFSHYTDPYNKYNYRPGLSPGASVTVAGAGRGGARAAYFPSETLALGIDTPYKSGGFTFPADYATVGFALRVPTTIPVGVSLCYFEDNSGAPFQEHIRFGASGSIELWLYRVDTATWTFISNSATGVITTGTYHYLQWAFGNTGVAVISVDGTNVILTSNALAHRQSMAFYIGPGVWGSPRAADYYITDLVVRSDHTTQPAFLGDVSVAVLRPAATGAENGGNYLLVNDVLPDGDTSYIAVSTLDETFLMGNVTSMYSPCPGIQPVIVGRDTSPFSGSQLRARIFTNSTTYTESLVALGWPTDDLYAGHRMPAQWDVNPVTSAAWTLAELIALRAGWAHLTNTTRVTQLVVEFIGTATIPGATSARPQFAAVIG